YAVNVLQKPAVKKFIVTYTYPSYTQRAPLKVSNEDGLIEAPVGTQAMLEVVVNEELKVANLQMGERMVPLERAETKNVFRTALSIVAEQRWQLRMVSAHGVEGAFPGVVQVRAVVDRPPLVRLLAPEGDVRMHARDILPLTFAALDDFGISKLSVQVQINAKDAPPVNIPLRGDPRRQEA